VTANKAYHIAVAQLEQSAVCIYVSADCPEPRCASSRGCRFQKACQVVEEVGKVNLQINDCQRNLSSSMNPALIDILVFGKQHGRLWGLLRFSTKLCERWQFLPPYTLDGIFTYDVYQICRPLKLSWSLLCFQNAMQPIPGKKFSPSLLDNTYLFSSLRADSRNVRRGWR